jgi:hypothetical protein
VQSVAFITFAAIAIVQGAVVQLVLISRTVTLLESLMMSYGHDFVGTIIPFKAFIKRCTHLLIGEEIYLESCALALYPVG